ncbi:hypothetical protein PROFUN_10800 [Planoprotostelium fungivorum]|uniref:Uncharacterized protein n=1 Tax=Planoprotostelium fungivorum TaxID=1890364 RepID=A0A2P6NCY7_9EUKA|nr:hypothetical protein PROFUN_10800 [Planoprotostelium fungivorum]
MSDLLSQIESSHKLVADKATSAKIDDEKLEKYVNHLDLAAYKDSTRPLRFPLRFDNIREEVNFLSLFNLLSFGSGYRAELYRSTQRGASETILYGLLGLQIGSHRLDTEFLQNFLTTDVEKYFGIPLNVEKEIRPAIMTEVPSELRPLAEMILKVLNNTGNILRNRAYEDFGKFVMDQLPEGDGSASDFITKLASVIPSFDDKSKYDTDIIYFHKKTQSLALDLYRRFGKEDSRFKFTDADRLSALADSSLAASLRREGIITLDDALAKKIDEGKEINTSREEVELRAVSSVACKRVGDKLRERFGGEEDIFSGAIVSHHFRYVGKNKEGERHLNKETSTLSNILSDRESREPILGIEKNGGLVAQDRSTHQQLITCRMNNDWFARSDLKNTAQKATKPILSSSSQSVSEQLEASPLWNSLAREGSLDTKGGGQLFAIDPDLTLFTWDGLHLFSVNLREVKNDLKHRVKSPINMKFPVREVSLNYSGSLIALVGRTECSISRVGKRSMSSDDKLRTFHLKTFNKGDVEILRVQWHPLSSHHLCILTSDSILRDEEAEQVIPLGKTTVAFSFCRFADPWSCFSIFYLSDNGFINLLCPVVPYDCEIPVTLLGALEKESSEKNKSQWLTWIESISTPTPDNSSFVTTRKPQQIVQPMVQDILNASHQYSRATGATDINVCSVHGLVVVSRITQNGKLDTFVKLDPISPQWLGEKNSTDGLTMYEQIDLQLPEGNNPKMMRDSASLNLLYVCHGAGIHQIDLVWLPSLLDESGKSDENSSRVKMLYRSMSDREGDAAHLLGVSVVNEPLLGNILLLLTKDRRCKVIDMQPTLATVMNKFKIAEQPQKMLSGLSDPETLSISNLRHIEETSYELQQRYAKWLLRLQLEIVQRLSQLNETKREQEEREEELKEKTEELKSSRELFDYRVKAAVEMQRQLEERMKLVSEHVRRQKKQLSSAERDFFSEVRKTQNQHLKTYTSQLKQVEELLRETKLRKEEPIKTQLTKKQLENIHSALQEQTKLLASTQERSKLLERSLDEDFRK